MLLLEEPFEILQYALRRKQWTTVSLPFLSPEDSTYLHEGIYFLCSHFVSINKRK